MSEFVTILQAFLELQTHGENFVEYALDVAYDFLADETAPADFRENLTAIYQGEQEAYRALHHKAFPDVTLRQLAMQSNEWLERLQPKGNGKGGFANHLVGQLLNKLLPDGKTVGELMAAEKGMTIAEVRKEMIDELNKLQRERELLDLRKPPLHRFLLRMFLSRLDQMVEEIEQLDELDLEWDFVPVHLQTLLANAHEAALSGNKIAAAVCFGAAIEEALKVQMGRDRCKDMSSGIKMALTEGKLKRPSPAYDAISKVQRWRNEAVHEPARFLENPVRPTELLDYSRFAIVHLFSGKA